LAERIPRAVMNLFGRLNNYAEDHGFANETERLQMILDAMDKDMDAVDHWMDFDGSKAGLAAILGRKRKVRRPELDV
jgi:hypothetical protein